MNQSSNSPTPQSTTAPIDWRQAATSHLRRIGELMAERDAAEASRDRLRDALDESLHLHCDRGCAGELAPIYAHLQPGDLDGAGEGGDV